MTIGKEKIVIQVRKYPFIKGTKSKSIVVEDDNVQVATARIDILYRELDKNGIAKVVFYK